MLESFIDRYPPAVLVLADGNVFSGYSIGADKDSVGEVVFNTSMTGYQEIITDPSYHRQIVTLTYPHIGNVGVNSADMESLAPFLSGLVISQNSLIDSNWRSTLSLDQSLKKNNVSAIAGIDTRRLTRLLRDKGSQLGCIMVNPHDLHKAFERIHSFGTWLKEDEEVGLKKITEWKGGSVFSSFDHRLDHKRWHRPHHPPYHVVVYDYGVKHTILRLLIDYGCRVTVVPAQTNVSTVLALGPDGVVLSNGPGDPAVCLNSIRIIRSLITKNIPLFGVCLGFQLLALAFGAKTQKMSYGHHGSNHPVKELHTQCVYITSQNHGFAVDESSLPACLVPTHRSLFDDTLQGFKHLSKPIIGFQGHPEAAPGPTDIQNLFEQFIQLMSD